jgi:hypothetical protein
MSGLVVDHQHALLARAAARCAARFLHLRFMLVVMRPAPRGKSS